MILKYADGVDPFRGEVIGGVYQRYAAGEQMMATKKNDRYPYALQWQRASTLIGITRFWRMLTDGERDAWNTFAVDFPQPTQWNPARFLNGYNLFCRWNFFNRLVNGQAAPILTEPDMSEVADTTLTPTITNNLGSLILDAEWSRTGADIWGAVFMSRIVSAGSNYIASQPRFIIGIDNGGGVVIKYGMLYNWWAGTNALGFTSSNDWALLTSTQMAGLRTYLGGTTVAGGKMKLTGTDWWSSPNTGATNSAKTNCPGAGNRTQAGVFGSFNSVYDMLCSNQYSATDNYLGRLGHNSANISTVIQNKRVGHSILIRTLATGISDGTESTYTGNNGQIYPTVAIGGYYYNASPIIETKYRDGSNIPEVTLAADWAVLTTGARCTKDNNPSYAFIIEPTTYDITAEYFNMFGRLPQTGEKILMKVIKFNKISGQFLPEEEFFLEVL
jgi:hypothetical protein